MRGQKIRGILLITVLVLAMYPIQSVAASWAEPIFDAEVPAKTRENVAKAIDTTADLLIKYKIALPKDIKIIVAADFEGYVQAYMFYGNVTRAEAEKMAYSYGISIWSKPVIIIKSQPDPAQITSTVAHEIFHQVQNQYGKALPVNWLLEGTPEMFGSEALEVANLGKVDVYVRQSENIIRKAPTIPDVREMANYNYETYIAQVNKNYPVYQMSTVMTSRLIADNGFENIVFFYQLLHNGTLPDKAFVTAFRVPMSWFLADMNTYFEKLRSGK